MDQGTYLGFVIGLDAKDDCWQKLLRKCSACAKMWGCAGVGSQYATMAYTTYVLHILLYIRQFCDPLVAALEGELNAFRAFVSGPGNWCIRQDMYYMADSFGQAWNFPSLVHVCAAAEKRVYVWEDRAQGGLAIEGKLSQLQNAMSNTEHLGRIVQWREFYKNGPWLLCIITH